MKSSNQKLKLLYLMKILLEQTDEEHPMSVPQLIAELKRYDVSAERKSIYDDLECLRLFGLDICSVKTKTYGYFVASRDFELPELKLLVDSVQASKFITKKKSLELISKIEGLAGKYAATKLRRQVYVTNRVKTVNEQIYYNVDKIYEAISENRQITFRYFELDVDKNKSYRKNGGLYTESPLALSWDDENYYLIVYKKKYGNFAHYRVDKMDNIELCNEKRDLPEKEFDLSEYTKSVFSMFGGKAVNVSVKFENSLAGVVFDRFGTDVPTMRVDENHFVCNLNVAVSPVFLGWLVGFGSKAEILSPDFVIDEMKELVKQLNNTYQ
jgi:predicted DNA-binding transcriptional regulator YafY